MYYVACRDLIGEYIVKCVEDAFHRLSQDVTESELRILNKQLRVTGHPAKTVYDYLTFLQHRSQQDIDLRKHKTVNKLVQKRFFFLNHMNIYTCKYVQYRNRKEY